ncbi:MAG TPA: choice-of-anchor P family protein [Jatrophihabitantaceae bacterium]|jgi:hypothetical protein|nr:choice-of-anchor P family protein [Jatrophihabitantaceae bacterium]
MNRRSKQVVALFATATVVTLMWPGPSSADDSGTQTTLSGFDASLTASPVRIQIFDQGIPGPPDPNKPQLDMGIAYSHSEGSAGRMSSTASYFWPGDLIGNGLGQLVPNANYTVRADSSYPATESTPASDKVQITDGNGMQTSADSGTTTATTTGLGIEGTNVLSGLFENIGKIFGQKPSANAPKPLVVPNPLAGLVSLKNVTSDTNITVGKDSVTATAHAAMSSLDLLGGLISLNGFDVKSTTVSDGKKATVDGVATVGGLSVLGQTIALDTKGVDLAGNATPLPQLPDLLSTLGLSIKWLHSDKKVTSDDSSAGGTFDAYGMELTVDMTKLWTMFHVDKLMAPIADLLSKIPQFGSILGAIVTYAPKIVIDVGSVQSSLTASPAFNFTSPGGSTGGGGGVPVTNTGGGSGVGGVSTGGGFGGGTTPVGGLGTGLGNTGGGSSLPNSNPGTNMTPSLGTPQSAGFEFPALGKVPRMLILGALVLAAALGWLLRAAALTLFGAGGNCEFGLARGVPDLRKG